jgi:alpha-L-fucosidase 2
MTASSNQLFSFVAIFMALMSMTAVTFASERELIGMADRKTGPMELWYAKPAGAWTEGLAIGNGRLGAMVFGNVDADRLQLNDITVWSGGPNRNADRVDAYKALPEIRRLLADGKYTTARNVVQRYMTSSAPYLGSYQTLGDLNFNYVLPPGAVTDYERWLDISRAVAGVSFKMGGATYTRETFASAPAQVIAIRLGCDKKSSISFSIGLSRQSSAVSTVLGANGLLMTGNTDYQKKPGAVDYEVQVRVIPQGGTVSASGNQLTIRAADEATILVASGSTYTLDWDKQYRGENPHAAISQALATAAGSRFKELEAAHIADFKSFFDRVELSVGSSAADQLPTDERLKQFGDGKKDPSLAALYYQFGRYLLICSSRPDNPLPSNSQGLWGDGLDLPWKCDYKSNINFQMNYWPAESANLSDCHLPMLRLIRSLMKPGRATAKAYYNAPGWVCAYTTNPFGWTSPGAGLPWGPFFAGSGWDCQHLWEHYAFSRDKGYLKSIYPVMREACEFYLSILVPDANGMLITSPSVSPENDFKTETGEKSSVDAGCAVEREIIWDLFTNTIQASKSLGIDDQFRQQLADARAKIRPLQIGKAGQLQEWSKDWDMNGDLNHRHVSHLFALFPGKQITIDATPALATAAKKSLEIRTDIGTGWSKAWKINLWARLRDGDHAFTLLAEQLHLVTSSTREMTNGGGTYGNMFDAHPPFQIDGNFGGTSGVNEMLLQSHVTYSDARVPDEDFYVIDLLPALPAAWPTGHVRGLRARGGFSVDESWENGTLISAKIQSVSGTQCRINLGSSLLNLSLRPGESKVIDPKAFRARTFDH